MTDLVFTWLTSASSCLRLVISRPRTSEVRRRSLMLENIVLILISLLLLGYLMYALLKPENF